MFMPSLVRFRRPYSTSAAGALLIVILFSVILNAAACGPGRSGHRRPRPRKLTPLVFKQHVPNVSENSVTASGLTEGKITRDDPKFLDLVPNYNADITFRDEEGTGADRLMSPRCKEKLNTLAISVMNQWPGIKLRVTESYDEEGLHAAGSLHYEGRAVDVTTSDRDRSKYGMLARLAVEAGFDFVYYESRSHIHLSVKSESADASRSGGCFHGNSFVQTPDGSRKMSELAVGDKVLVAKPDGTFKYSEVILFLDRNEESTRLFHTIVTESGLSITLTPSHLIFVARNDKKTIDIRTGYATFAKNVEPGHYVYVKNQHSENIYDTTNQISVEKVVKVEHRNEIGVFAPLTFEGNLLVNHVLASSYAVIRDQALAHSAFLPVRLVDNFMKSTWHFLQKFHFVKLRTKSVTRKHMQQQNGIHWYPRMLYKVTRLLLPEKYLYL